MPGFSGDPLDILLGHNHWATRDLLERCRVLTPEQFHQHFDIGPGSLHDTLTHIAGAILRWADRIDGPPRLLRPSIERPAGAPEGGPTLDMPRRTPDELIAILNDACADFADVVSRQRPRLAEVRVWTFGSDTYRFTVCAAIIHVTNHGMHHRAQCMNMLKQLGHPVNADLDELEWQLAGEP